MDRHRSSNPGKEQRRSRQGQKNKQNPVTDAVFLIQNQNDVLRMKNSELNVKIKELKLQLQNYTDGIALHERDIENIRGNITNNTYQEDLQIENQKKLLTQKLILLKSNEEILARKIKQAREATIFQEEKVAAVQNDRKGIQMNILSLRAQNQGTKVVLSNLQQQNQKLRAQNERLISKRKIFEPKEKQISVQIQERIRFIKNQQEILRRLKKNQTAKLLCSSLSLIHLNKQRACFSRIQRYSLLRKLGQKKMIQLSLIQKKYLLGIKHRIVDSLRGGFRPLVQQETARRIINETHKRRIKAFIWRKWRLATKEAQFSTTRQFQFQNTLEKISQSFQKTNLYASLAILKHFRNNPFHQRSVIVLQNIWSNFTNRCKVQFFSAMRSAQQKYQISKEIQSSSKGQSELLVMSLYFTAWAKTAKARAIQNLSIKRRYFKEIKKLIALRRRRKLGQILNNANQKIKNVDTLSKSFLQMKKQATTSRIEGLIEEEGQIQERRLSLEEELKEMHADKKALYQQLSLLRISKYLKTKMQRAFDIWRLRKQQSKVILTIINLMESKKSFDKNFGFARILKKRFAMLKKSINDKIASCEYSYNYLLDQNRHIKEVLDHKQHELEKSKFMNILLKICRNQKEYKLKYFYKFMRSGFKFWKFRKLSQRIDQMAQTKIKMVFIWLLKRDMTVEKQQSRIQNYVLGKQKFINNRLTRNVFKAFQSVRSKNKRLKSVIGGIFQRNLELDFYAAFGKIRNEEHIHYRGLIQEDIDELQGQIDKTKGLTSQQDSKMEALKERLSYKEDTLAERKLLSLYNFFIKNIKNKFGGYIKRWRSRVTRENRVLEFAQVLQRKSRIMLKNRFMQYINKKHEDFDLTELQDKYQKFSNEYDKMATNQEKFLQDNEKQITRMKGQNEVFKQQGAVFEKKTDHMTKLKLKSHAKSWGKKMMGFCLKGWRQQTDIFINTWSQINNSQNRSLLKESFTDFTKLMKEEIFKARIRNNLDKIYTKTWRFNAGLGFRTWKYTLMDKRINLWTEEEKRQMKRFEGLEKKFNYAVGRHDSQVIYRQYDPKIRALWNIWRQYTQNKIYNSRNQAQLSTWLFRGYGSELLRLVKRKVNKKIQLKQRFNAFVKRWQDIRVKSFLEYTSQNKYRRKSVERLFINKFSPFLIHKTLEEAFSRIKNFGSYQEVLKKTDRTMRIQTVIQAYEKKRKAILSANMVKWRRNQYQIRIAKNLLRRITRNAMNWRVRDLFFSWKLQTQAKRVKQMHQEEGEVKKRRIQINRLKIFLQDFKKDKGLLLEDEGGKFVLSPRFQEKKDQQVKRDNNLRYKFISRLILSMNGYAAPVKAYNNLRTYMLLREKYKKNARLVRNNLRRPEVAYAFKVWHKASVDFNKMFDTMQRKGLIKILNRQKDKMEMEYSKKVSLEEKIQDQMRMHKLLSYHEERKQKLAAYLLLKNVRKIKMYALLTWRERIRESKEVQLQNLEDQGNGKINELEEEINDLQESERDLRSNNHQLEQAVRQALDIAEMVKRITQERDMLSKMILEKQLTCQSLQEQNEGLNAKLYQAQKEAMNLLILSGERL